MHIDAVVRVPSRNVQFIRRVINRPIILGNYKPQNVTRHNLVIDITRYERTPSDLLQPVYFTRDIIRRAEIAIDKGLANWHFTRPNIILHTLERQPNSLSMEDDITEHFIKKGFTVFDYDDTTTIDIYKDLDRVAGYLKEGRMPEFARCLSI